MLERPEHFCKANCEHWAGSECGYMGNRKYPCAFFIDQVVRTADDTLIKFRMGFTWYDAEWNEIPPKKRPDPGRAGCC